MGMIHIFERGGDDAKRFDEAMKRAKSGLMEACEIWEDMKSQFSERGSYSDHNSYGERWSPREDAMQYRHGMYDREYDGMYERRYRDGMGRYR